MHQTRRSGRRHGAAAWRRDSLRWMALLLDSLCCTDSSSWHVLSSWHVPSSWHVLSRRVSTWSRTLLHAAPHRLAAGAARRRHISVHLSIVPTVHHSTWALDDTYRRCRRCETRHTVCLAFQYTLHLPLDLRCPRHHGIWKAQVRRPCSLVRHERRRQRGSRTTHRLIAGLRTCHDLLRQCVSARRHLKQCASAVPLIQSLHRAQSNNCPLAENLRPTPKSRAKPPLTPTPRDCLDVVPTPPTRARRPCACFRRPNQFGSPLKVVSAPVVVVAEVQLLGKIF